MKNIVLGQEFQLPAIRNTLARVSITISTQSVGGFAHAIK